MLKTAISIFSLLLGTAILLLGISLQGTLLTLRADFEGFAVSTTGIVMSAYFIGYAAGTRYTPPLIREIGHIRTFAVFATIASAAAIAHAMFPTPLPWFTFRFLTGFCLVGLLIVIESWLNAIAPEQGRGGFFSVYMIITLLSMGAGQYLILLADIGGFDLFAITTILISVALVPVAMTRIRQPEVPQTGTVSLPRLFHEAPLGVMGTFTAGAANSTFWALSPLYALGAGLDVKGVAMLISITVLGGALLQWPIGRLSDHHDRRTVLMAIVFAAALICTLGYLSPGVSPAILMAGGFLFGSFALTIYGVSVSHANDRLDPSQMLEGSKGLMQVYGIGAILGPSLTGVIMQQFGYNAFLLFLLSVYCVLLLFGAYRMLRREAPPLEEQTEFMPMNRTSPVALNMNPMLEEESGVDPSQT